MSLKDRIETLERLAIGGDDAPELIIISTIDASLGGDTEPMPSIAIIPGSTKKAGFTLTRGETETPGDFTTRAKESFNSFWGIK